MLSYNDLLDLFLANFRKILYPEEWIDLDLEFSKSELFAMLIVDRHGEVIMSQIADYLNIPLSTATGLINRLVKHGYVKRERSETDRRIVVIRLADPGKETVARLKGTVLRYLSLIQQTLTAEEQEMLLDVFRKVLNVLGRQDASGDTQRGSGALERISID